ncbi:MAG: hypothetical protein LGB07_01095 [Sulfurovum sp.]|nr:hypothetical protein [Sulfurovum sp.]
MYFKKRFLYTILLIYLLSSFLQASHIHHDKHTSHDNCNICIVVKNLHGANITPPCILEKVYFNDSKIVNFIAHIEPYRNLKYIYSQAPPLFS